MKTVFWSTLGLSLLVWLFYAPVPPAKAVADPTLAAFFDLCQQDRLCHWAYPEVTAVYGDLTTQLQDDPLVVQAVPINDTLLNQLLLGLVGHAETCALVPGLLYELQAGNTTPLETVLPVLTAPPAPAVSVCGGEEPLFGVTAVRTLPFAKGFAFLATAFSLGLALWFVPAFGHWLRRGQLVWRLPHQRPGWKPLLLQVVVTLCVFVFWRSALGKDSLAWAAGYVYSLVVAVHIALALSPNDESALEVMLACERPFYWLAVERILLAFVWHLPMALLLMAVGYGGLDNAWPSVNEWLLPAIFLAGLTAVTTIYSQESSLSLLIAGLGWFGLGLVGPGLLPAGPTLPVWTSPTNYIQPFLWTLHPFFPSGWLPDIYYSLNRLIILGVGLALLALSARLLTNNERLLLGK